MPDLRTTKVAMQLVLARGAGIRFLRHLPPVTSCATPVRRRQGPPRNAKHAERKRPRPGRVYIDLTQLTQTQIRVAVTPLPSVLALVADTLGHRPSGVPSAWRRALAPVLGRSELAAFEPVCDIRGPILPDCALPLPDEGVSNGDDALELIAGTDPDVLIDQLARDYGSSLPPAWRAVEPRPRDWLRSYERALSRATGAIAPIWIASTALLEREVERLGVAAVNGSIRELLATLHPGFRLDGDVLSVPRRAEGDAYCEVSSQGLVLVPIVAGRLSRLVARTESGVTHLGYPLPGLERLLSGDATSPEGLAVLIGPARARLLHALDRPTHAGALADVLQAVPSAVTHHLGVLEAAGLIYRQRDGKHVVVTRTARATALLALYGA